MAQRQDITLSTPRGDFAASLFGTPDTSKDDEPKFRPVTFFIHGAGMNKEGFSALCPQMISLCSGTPAPAAAPSTSASGQLPPSSADSSVSSTAQAKPTHPSLRGPPRPLAPGNPAPQSATAGGPPLPSGPRQVGRGGPVPLQSGPGLFDPTMGGGRKTDAQKVELRCVAFDLRGHGNTQIDEDGILSREVFLADCKACILHAMETLFPSQRFFYLVGHSLGGSLAAYLAHDEDLKPKLGGLVLLDIVEDTAKQSLVHMDDYLDKRPSSFKDPSEAVKWMFQKGGMKNLEAASVTVPTLLRKEEQKDGGGGRVVDGTGVVVWGWRTNLRATKPHWQGWFEGMDDLFVSVSCPKVLCLANTQRLDTKLTTAHMQGKFQFEVIGSHAGHYLMEDDPVSVAIKLTSFLKRVEALTAKLPPVKK